MMHCSLHGSARYMRYAWLTSSLHSTGRSHGRQKNWNEVSEERIQDAPQQVHGQQVEERRGQRARAVAHQQEDRHQGCEERLEDAPGWTHQQDVQVRGWKCALPESWPAKDSQEDESVVRQVRARFGDDEQWIAPSLML
jgi:hypothetical protein